MIKIEIRSEKDIIDFTNFFSAKDFEYMRCQLKQNKIDLALEQYNIAKEKYDDEASISIVSMKIANINN